MALATGCALGCASGGHDRLGQLQPPALCNIARSIQVNKQMSWRSVFPFYWPPVISHFYLVLSLSLFSSSTSSKEIFFLLWAELASLFAAFPGFSLQFATYILTFPFSSGFNYGSRRIPSLASRYPQPSTRPLILFPCRSPGLCQEESQLAVLAVKVEGPLLQKTSLIGAKSYWTRGSPF